jgi:hypothetical protein
MSDVWLMSVGVSKGVGEKGGGTNLRNTSTLLEAQLIRLVDEHVCAHGNVLCISAAVCQTKHSITLLESVLTLRSKLFNYTAEFDSESCRSLRRERVVAFALEQVHAVETKGLDTDESLCGRGLGTFDLVDEEGSGGALAILDVCVSCQLGVRFHEASGVGRRTDCTHVDHCGCVFGIEKNLSR